MVRGGGVTRPRDLLSELVIRSVAKDWREESFPTCTITALRDWAIYYAAIGEVNADKFEAPDVAHRQR